MSWQQKPPFSHQLTQKPEGFPRRPAVPCLPGLSSTLPASRQRGWTHLGLERSHPSCACLVASVVSNSLQPRGLQLTRLLCPWGSPDKNTGVGCHFPLQGILFHPGCTWRKQERGFMGQAGRGPRGFFGEIQDSAETQGVEKQPPDTHT